MTWSIVVHDPESGAFAVAVATRAFAVGASCPHVRAGIGAVSTQSITNRYLGPAVLDGMARGLTAAAAIRSALAADDGAGLRQIHAVDARGGSFAWTGENCVEWCGSIGGDRVSVAGNMLAGEAVVAETLRACQAGAATALPERLMAAMEAGERAGGDRRGKQSAAMKLVTTEDFPDLDLRVDDHADPLAELRRLLGIWRRDRAPFLERSPSKANPSGFTDLDAIEAAWIAAGSPLRLRRPSAT